MIAFFKIYYLTDKIYNIYKLANVIIVLVSSCPNPILYKTKQINKALNLCIFKNTETNKTLLIFACRIYYFFNGKADVKKEKSSIPDSLPKWL